MLYSFSFNQSYRWLHEHATKSDIITYLEDTVTKSSLRQHVHTSVEVIKAHWIDDKNTWCVRLRDLKTGEEYNRYCTVLISAAGAQAKEVPITPQNPMETISDATAFSHRHVPLLRRMQRIVNFMAEDLGSRRDDQNDNVAFRHSDVEIIGARDNTSLSQYWKETRQPQAYWGSLLASFPNFGLVSIDLVLLLSCSLLISTRCWDHTHIHHAIVRSLRLSHLWYIYLET